MTLIKRLTFSGIILVVFLAFAELAAVAFYIAIQHRAFPYAKFQSAMQAVGQTHASDAEPTERAQEDMSSSEETLHPYLGFVRNPQIGSGISPYGFHGDTSPLFAASTNRLVVAVFGGSFGAQFAAQAADTLAQALRPLGKGVAVVNLALEGYKQPQQLLALTYFLALGAKIDVVINLDGFNEIALSPAEEIPKGVFPLYPRSWFFRLSNVNDPRVAPKLLAMDAADQARTRWARFFTRNRLHHSIVLCLLWKSHDRMLENRKIEIMAALYRAKPADQADYAATGPALRFQTDAEQYEYLARAWQRCSLQIRDLCEVHRIAYFHFLQPNQYVEGSKPMSPEERQIAFDRDIVYRDSVHQGYPLLQRYGQELEQAGVNFYDLTMIFTNMNAVLYSDMCCHVNSEGYRIVARSIGQVIVEDFDRAPRK